eukprot:SAG22_NODE_163_length_16829_cov_9.946204_15_plen_114_part_00
MQRSSTRYKDVNPEFQEKFSYSLDAGQPGSTYVLQCVVQDAGMDGRPVWKGGLGKGGIFLGELSVDLYEAFDGWRFQSVELIRELGTKILQYLAAASHRQCLGSQSAIPEKPH